MTAWRNKPSSCRANVVRRGIQKTYGLKPIMDARVRGHDGMMRGHDGMMCGHQPMSHGHNGVSCAEDSLRFPSGTEIENSSSFRANVVIPGIQKTYGLKLIMDARVRGHDIRSDEAFI